MTDGLVPPAELTGLDVSCRAPAYHWYVAPAGAAATTVSCTAVPDGAAEGWLVKMTSPAKAILFAPPPFSAPRLSPAKPSSSCWLRTLFLAAARSAALTSAAEASVFVERNRAAIPATIGADHDVPDVRVFTPERSRYA